MGALVAAGLLLAPAFAAEAGGEVAVALPPFLVEETAKGPPWRHGQMTGFEILSRCNDATTQRVVEAHHRLHELLAEILPPPLRLQFSVQPTFILYDEELQPASSREVIQQMLQPRSGLPAEDAVPTLGSRGLRFSPPAPRYSFLPNLRLWDRDAMAVFMIVRRDSFDTERLSLTPDYVKYLLLGRLPTLPHWFVSGVLTLYQQISYEGDRLVLEPLHWPAPLPSAASLSQPGAEPPVRPVSQILQPSPVPSSPAATNEPAGSAPSGLGKTWQAHAALLVRWGLDADNRSHRQALWTYVERSAAAGNSEALFAECFGFDYATARQRLLAYLPIAVAKRTTFRLPKSFRVPTLTLTNASEGQIARIKGDWERMEVPYVQGLSPTLAPKYLELARRTLRRAYDRDYRDPDLLAVMGLCEVDGGNDEGARAFLESAAQIGSLRPRANYELARLRLAEHRRQPGAPPGRLATAQLVSVLQPLFAARAAPPPLPEIYELAAEAWSLSEVKPTRGHLAVLDEGVRLFPRRFPLLLQAAGLFLTHGYREEAGAVIDLARRFAADDTTRRQVEDLSARLASTTAP